MRKRNKPTRQPSLAETEVQTKIGGRPTGRVSKRDWLEKALKIFQNGGIDAVRVVDLAQQLHIAKSGFYWHFRDRADLLTEMQKYWVDEFSHQFIKDTQETDAPFRERLVALIQALREKQSGKLDLAFTSWAQTDPVVRDLVDDVRDMRLAFVRDLLRELNLKEEELNARARLFVVYFAWSDVMFDGQADSLAEENFDLVLEIIVGDRLQ